MAKNSLVERRRMRNDRKKRKRHQRRKNEYTWKVDANMDVLSERLRIETKEKERFLYLPRKYHLKWRQNKEIITTLQDRAVKQPSTSSCFGMRTKVHVGFCFCLFIVYFFFENSNSNTLWGQKVKLNLSSEVNFKIAQTVVQNKLSQNKFLYSLLAQIP